MTDLPVTREDVMRWIDESLADYRGRYDVQDLTFVRAAVRVVTPRRDSRFDVGTARWPELVQPETRLVMTEELQRWARAHLSAGR